MGPPGERGFTVALLVVVIGYCVMILSSSRVAWLRANRERIASVLVLVLLVVVSLYLFVVVLPGGVNGE